MPLLASDKKDVLVVCPFPLSGTWAVNTLEPIHMLENTRPDLRIWSAVMRNSSFRSVQEYDEQAKTIFNHYSAKRPDLIVIFGPGNYILADDFERAWPNVPMVLLGELNYVCTKDYVCDSIPKIASHRIPMKTFARGKNMSFVYSPVYMSETIDLICKNQPYVKNLYFITGQEFVAREIELNMHKVAKALGFSFTPLHPGEITYRDLHALAADKDKNTTAFIYCNWHSKSDMRDPTVPYIGVRRSLERFNLMYSIYYTIIDADCQTAGFVSYNHAEFKNTLQSMVCAVIDRGENFLYKKQKALLDSSERYYALINNAPFNYSISELVYNDAGEITDIIVRNSNNSLKQNMDNLKLFVDGKSLMETFPVSTPRFIGHIADGIREKQKTIRFSHEMIEMNCYYEILVILGREENVIHIFSLDTTQLMVAQKELQAEKEKAERSDQLKTMFVQNVSHEIRTPLNAVVGFSQLLSMPDDVVSPQEKEDYVKYIQNNSELLIMLVNDILSIGDVERGQFVVNISDVRCNYVCQQSMRTAETRLPDGVKLYYTSEVDDDYTIKSDEHRIQQVLVNFLTNACKHTEKGEIHVHSSLTEKPGMITFSVTDTGTGVPADEAEHIFERFTKLNAFKQGAGLGLSICKNIATILKGDVHLDTSYTNGARFVFQLPLD